MFSRDGWLGLAVVALAAESAEDASVTSTSVVAGLGNAVEVKFISSLEDPSISGKNEQCASSSPPRQSTYFECESYEESS